MRLRKDDGSADLRYVDFIYQPLLDSDGKASGVFVQGHDVTELKLAEAALRAADERKDEFLAILAHELRNPLAPIRHAAGIGNAPGVTERQLKWAHEVIDRQVDHMSRLLDDLLDVSRITRGKLELRLQPVDLGESVLLAANTVRPMIEARGHRFDVETPAEAVTLVADPVRFTQILSNLLTNAAKYTDAGGHIRVVAEKCDGNAVIRVQDNGIGIAPAGQADLFRMFSQVTSALNRSEGGLGIGLSLTRGLVALHGGTITVQSEGAGQGSAVTVSLPLRPSAAPSTVLVAPDAAPVDAGDQRPLRVLVVDDNRDVAEGCALLLELQGHDVRIAHSGDEALAHLQRFEPELALIDIGMPGMHGYELARRIRATSNGDRILLVAVTGWGQEDDRLKATAAGFDEHRAKPVGLDTLSQLIRAAHANADRLR